jgi:hypothetical protein
MKPSKQIFSLLVILLLIAPNLRAQLYIGVKLIGLSFHFKTSQHPHLFKRKLDKKGHFVINSGIALTFEYRFDPYMAVKFDQAFLSDCAGKFAGASLLTLRTQAQLGKFGEGTIGMGPFFYYRRSWRTIEGYVDPGLFHLSKNGKWEAKFVWYGGELELNYPLNASMDLSTNILPAIPVMITIAPGLRWKL